MTLYRHAIWPPSKEWASGYGYAAPVEKFREVFPKKVKEHGAPLRVWDAEAEAPPEER